MGKFYSNQSYGVLSNIIGDNNVGGVERWRYMGDCDLRVCVIVMYTGFSESGRGSITSDKVKEERREEDAECSATCGREQINVVLMLISSNSVTTASMVVPWMSLFFAAYILPS